MVRARFEMTAIEPVASIEALYTDLLPLLVGIGVKKFGLDSSDAEALAHEIFVDYLTKSEKVVNSRSYLVAAMHNGCRYHLRKHGRIEALPEEIEERPAGEEPEDAIASVIAAGQALKCLTARCQFALRLRYLAGYTMAELAAELRTTSKYAEKVVSDCLKQARRRYLGGQLP